MFKGLKKCKFKDCTINKSKKVHITSEHLSLVKEAVLEYIYQKAFHISHHLLDWKLTWLNLNQVNFQNTSTTQKQKQFVKIKLIACKIVNNSIRTEWYIK